MEILLNDDPEGTIFTSSNKIWTIVESIPEVIKSHLKEHSENLIIAGGFLRDGMLDLAPKDLDVFCKTEKLARDLANFKNGGLGVVKTDCSYTSTIEGLRTQYIYCRPFTDVMSLLNEFDFTCCGIGVQWRNERWICSTVDDFFKDTETKTLIFRCAEYNKGNLGAMYRAFKFVSRGWFIPQEEIAKIVHHYDGTKSLESVKKAVNPTYNARRRSAIHNPNDNAAPEPEALMPHPVRTLTSICLPDAPPILGDNLNDQRDTNFPNGTVLGYSDGLIIQCIDSRESSQR